MATIITGKGVKFVDHDHPHIAEELVMIHLLRNQQDFQGLGRRQQAVGLLGEYLVAFALRRVTVPESGSPTDKPPPLAAVARFLLISMVNTIKCRDRSPSLPRHNSAISVNAYPCATPVRRMICGAIALVWELTPGGTKHVITRFRHCNSNLWTQLCRIIARAGLVPWPKLFQNLRTTRETELADQYPPHVVCYWVGNSEKVARDHYLQVTDEHFELATGGAAESGAQVVQNEVQQPAATSREA